MSVVSATRHEQSFVFDTRFPSGARFGSSRLTVSYSELLTNLFLTLYEELFPNVGDG
jgi:hypothetical protein